MLDISFLTAVRAAVVTNLLIQNISPLTSLIFALREKLVAKLVILGISFLTSFILTFIVAVVANLVLSDILSSIFVKLTLYESFLTTFLSTT